MTNNEQTASEALKPCPFCGAVPDREDDVYSSWVQCPKCGAEGPSTKRLEKGGGSIAAWNSRTESKPVTREDFEGSMLSLDVGAAEFANSIAAVDTKMWHGAYYYFLASRKVCGVTTLSKADIDNALLALIDDSGGPWSGYGPDVGSASGRSAIVDAIHAQVIKRTIGGDSLVKEWFLDDFGYDGYTEDDVSELLKYAKSLEKAILIPLQLSAPQSPTPTSTGKGMIQVGFFEKTDEGFELRHFHEGMNDAPDRWVAAYADKEYWEGFLKEKPYPKAKPQPSHSLVVPTFSKLVTREEIGLAFDSANPEALCNEEIDIGSGLDAVYALQLSAPQPQIKPSFSVEEIERIIKPMMTKQQYDKNDFVGTRHSWVVAEAVKLLFDNAMGFVIDTTVPTAPQSPVVPGVDHE